MRFHHAELGQKLLEPIPIIAFALASVIEIPLHAPDGMLVKLCQTGQVPINTKVIEVPPNPGIYHGNSQRTLQLPLSFTWQVTKTFLERCTRYFHPLANQ